MSWLITGAEKSPVDPYRSQVSLLLHGDGTNGSTTIVDSSVSPKTVTAVGNAQISTAQSKFGGSSISFSGVAGDRLTLATSPGLALGTTFTIEFWAYFNNIASYKAGFISPDVSPFSGAGKLGFYLEGVGASQTFRYNFGGVGGTSSAGLLTSNTWYHVAFVCNNQTVTVYLMGSNIIGPTFNAAFDHTAQPQRIGDIVQFSGYDLNGYIDDLRITKGVARYTSNFTPPTAPFPDI